MFCNVRENFPAMFVIKGNEKFWISLDSAFRKSKVHCDILKSILIFFSGDHVNHLIFNPGFNHGRVQSKQQRRINYLLLLHEERVQKWHIQLSEKINSSKKGENPNTVILED